jgi:hypothetical protein
MTLKTYEVTGPGGTRVVKAATEKEARHLAMVERWGDVSDRIVPRRRLGGPDGVYEPYLGRGLTVRKVS